MSDETYMKRALALARRPAFTSPNPRVGAVLVAGNRVVGEGIHEGAGAPHAEVIAIEKAGLRARGATLYVNLEPCSHQGRTPPCAPQVARAGITRVVVAHEDPDPRVKGSGFEILRTAGVEVAVGVLAREARRLNATYLHQRVTGRPLVTLKLALSLDGRMAAADGGSRWITGELSRRRVHQRRLETDAVMVGSGTALQDDPLLTVREVPAPRQPLRIVLDSTGRTPPLAKVFGHDGPCLMATTDHASHEVQVAWKEKGAEVMVLPPGPGGVSVPALLDALGRRGLLGVYCEGGATLATSLLAQGVVDRLEMSYGPVLLGAGGQAIGDLGIAGMDDAERWSLIEQKRLGDDTWTVLERQAKPGV